ncbi:MFS transporter [Marinomonas shanghaiensis]|uniref:MFS transporter n=1 Tax=Marinomonas shanghaiensis TaxID=2202418 RepID=UPI003A8D82AC
MNNKGVGTVYLIALGAFSLGMASYVMAGLVPMVMNDFDVSVATAGQLVTAFTLAYGIGSPIFVALLPVNKQRTALLLALLIFSIANLSSAWAATYTQLVMTRILAGIGAGVYLAMGISAATIVVPKNQRGKSIAIVMGGMASGTVLGVPIGLILADYFGWASTMWLIAILGGVAVVGLTLCLPSLPDTEAASLREKLLVMADVKVARILTVSLLAAIASLGMYTYLASFMLNDSFGGVSNVTPWLWVWGIGGILGSFLVGSFTDRINDSSLVAIIMLILTLALLALPLIASISPWVAMLPIAIWGAVGWALQVPQNNQLIAVREGSGGGNVAVALNESALYLGSALGAAGGGLVYAFQLSLWILPVGAATIALLGLILQLLDAKKLNIDNAAESCCK